MSKADKRVYEFRPPDGWDQLPDWIKRVGNTVKLAGVVLAGDKEPRVLWFPHEQPDGEYHCVHHSPTPVEWSEILRRSDDPVYFEEHPGTKPWQRKAGRVISGLVQQKVWARDGLQCTFCGKRMGDVQLTVDHFIPLELGGANHPTNYTSACRRCNKDKGDREPEAYCRENGYDYDTIVENMRRPL